MSVRITVYYKINKEGYQLLGYIDEYGYCIWFDHNYPVGETSKEVASATFKDNSLDTGVALEGLSNGIINACCQALIY